VWCDIVAVNQHPRGDGVTHNENQEDVRAFDAVLRLCSGGTIVVCSVFYNPATRGWCIYEWDHTILHHGADGLHMPISLEDRVIVVNAINVEQAECFMPADKEMILGLVRRQTALERVVATVGGCMQDFVYAWLQPAEHRAVCGFSLTIVEQLLVQVRERYGTSAEFDSTLKRHFLLQPLSFKLDILRHRQRAAGTRWQWAVVDSWLASNKRALAVMAEAGTGKSCISAAIVDRLSKDPERTVVYHFHKHDDQRRQEPLNFVKTLAAQLCSR
jgi:hypothetical protein